MAYLDVEKINDQFGDRIIGGGGNVGVWVMEIAEVILIDNKYEVLEAVLMDALRIPLPMSPSSHMI